MFSAKKLSRCTRKIENCVKLASIQNKWHLLFLNNAPKKLQWYQISYEFAFVLIFLSVFIAFFSLIFIYLAMFAITYIQIIPFEIDCAIFYTSLHELFYPFISWTNWVNLWTIAEYHVKLWLIWKKFTLKTEYLMYIPRIKGQIISKRSFLTKDSPKKRTKTSRILVKTNSFVRFLGESSAWIFFSKLIDL